MPHGIFHAYGLFWELDEIAWTPGRGNRRQFRLLGRRGKNRPNLTIADFRKQQGIYILYGNYGPHYVGLTRKQTLGKRLKDHLTDKHQGMWDRFSWFSFNRVLKRQDADGLQEFSGLPSVRNTDTETAIGDVEALLIKAMGLANISDMKFAQAHQWFQIERDDVDKYITRLQER